MLITTDVVMIITTFMQIEFVNATIITELALKKWSGFGLTNRTSSTGPELNGITSCVENSYAHVQCVSGAH